MSGNSAGASKEALPELAVILQQQNMQLQWEAQSTCRAYTSHAIVATPDKPSQQLPAGQHSPQLAAPACK